MIVAMETKREGTAELVVDITGHGDFAVAEREAFLRAPGLMADLEAGQSLRLILRKIGDHAGEYDADGRIEAVVSRPHGGCRSGLLVGSSGLGFHHGKLGFERCNAFFVVLLQSVDLRSQLLRCRWRLRLGRCNR